MGLSEETRHSRIVVPGQRGAGMHQAMGAGFQAEMRWKGCQWIEGEPTADDACKCMAPVQRGLPYCPAHAKRCYGYVPDPIADQLPATIPMQRRRADPKPVQHGPGRPRKYKTDEERLAARRQQRRKYELSYSAKAAERERGKQRNAVLKIARHTRGLERLSNYEPVDLSLAKTDRERRFAALWNGRQHTIRDIAAALGVTSGTVSGSIWRMRQRGRAAAEPMAEAAE